MSLNKGRGCHIIKYFRFTNFRKNIIQFTLGLILLDVLLYFRWRMSVKGLILTDLIITSLVIIETLIIDWVQMRNKSSENGGTEETEEQRL